MSFAQVRPAFCLDFKNVRRLERKKETERQTENKQER